MLGKEERINIRNKFSELSSIDELANFLNTSRNQLVYYSIILPNNKKYNSFIIPKKSGGARQIYAPVKTLKYIQKQLARNFQALYEPINTTHGFIEKYEDQHNKTVNRSIVTNAKAHKRKQYLLNLDLKDFFPSFDSKRIYGLFTKQYNLDKKIAWYLTALTCNDIGLPQGAPTSPIITNMICSRLDRKLRRLASDYYITYTRYADDLSFSTRKKVFPKDFEERVREIISSEGLEVNGKKRRLLIKENHMEVTGLTVNEKPNVQRNYIRELRAIFHNIHNKGLKTASEDYCMKHKIDAHGNETRLLKNYLRGKILFLGQVKGEKDKIFLKYWVEFLTVFYPNQLMSENVQCESDNLIKERNKVLSQLDIDIVSSINDENEINKNIRKRIEEKLEKARKTLLFNDPNKLFETVYLIYFSCLNEFYHLHFDTEHDQIKNEAELHCDGKSIDKKKYSYKGYLFIPGLKNRIIHYIVENDNYNSADSSKKPPRLDQTSYIVPIYYYEILKNKFSDTFIKSFVILNEIRNQLNLTHGEESNIKNKVLLDRVNWIQCSWVYEFLYELFTAKNFGENKFFEKKLIDNLNVNLQEQNMEITGKVVKVKNRVHKDNVTWFDLKIEFFPVNSKIKQEIVASFSKTYPDGKEKTVYRAYEDQIIKREDFVKVQLKFSTKEGEKGSFNNITIIKIEKIESPESIIK